MKAKKIRKLNNRRDKQVNLDTLRKERYLRGKVKYGNFSGDWFSQKENSIDLAEAFSWCH